MSKIIPEIPEIPEEIISAVNKKKLAVFIGAGVSRIAGCSSWKDLASKVIKDYYNKGIISFKQKNLILHNNDPRKIITIAYNFLRDQRQDIFYRSLKKSLLYKKHKRTKQKKINIYENIYKLRGIFITTNADCLFHYKFKPQNIFYNKEDLHPDNISRNRLFHIHGNIKGKDDLVFTLSQYIERYNISNFRAFLEEIFNKFTILFLGYSLSEFDLLSFMGRNRSSLKNFILSPFYSGEGDRLKFEQAYYKDLGVQVVPYLKDICGYKQLDIVLKHWIIKINQSSLYIHSAFSETEDAIDNFNKKKALNVMQIIKNDNEQFNYFLKYLSKSSNSLLWLNILKNEDYFDPKKNPDPVESKENPGYYSFSHWEILDYLERITRFNAGNPKDEISDTLEEIVDDIIKNRNKNIYTDWNILKIISLFPNDKIKKEYIRFTGDILKSDVDPLLIAGEIEKSFLPKLIEVGEKEILLEFLKLALNYKEITKDDRIEYKPILESYYYDRSIKKYKKEFAKICGIDALQLGIKKIKEFIKINEKEFSKLRINTIEDHVQKFSGERYSFQLVSFVRDILEELSAGEIKDTVTKFLNHKHSIFKRLAIYAISHHYDDLNYLFWDFEGIPLDIRDAKLEIYELLKSNCEKFGNEEIEKLVNWIKNADYFISEEAKGDSKLAERQIIYRKKEWLTGVEKNNHPKIKEILSKYNIIVPEEVDHPGYDMWVGVATWSGVESDVNAEKIKDMPCEDIVEFLKTPIENKKYGRINEIGRADALREAIKLNPEKFYTCMKIFLDIDLIYQNEILRAYEEIWKDGKDIDWKKTFNFIVTLIKDKNFWRKKAEWDSTDYRQSAMYHIIQLIENGTKNDVHAFSPEFLPKSEEILLFLNEKIESDLFDMGDLPTTVLNSKQGQLFEAMVNYSLRYARVYKRKEKYEDERWKDSIKIIFTQMLYDGKKRSIEFSFILGQFLPNLFYLDKKWVNENIDRIFPRENEKYWNAAFTGYLYYSNKIYDNIYDILKKKGHYEKAINTKFDDYFVNEKLVQHISIGYIHGWEKLYDENSLINKLIKKKRIDHLNNLISFFSRSTNQDRELFKGKIKPLWEELYKVVKKNIGKKEFQKIASSLTQWVNLVDKIDEDIFIYLKFSVKYLGNDFYGRQFMEFLYTYVSNYPEETAQLYLKMIESGTFPSFEQKKIIYIVEFLYKKNIKKEANKICNIYADNLFFSLNDLYNKYNK